MINERYTTWEKKKKKKKLDIFVIIYLNDILVFSKDSNAHEEHLHWVSN